MASGSRGSRRAGPETTGPPGARRASSRRNASSTGADSTTRTALGPASTERASACAAAAAGAARPARRTSPHAAQPRRPLMASVAGRPRGRRARPDETAMAEITDVRPSSVQVTAVRRAGVEAVEQHPAAARAARPVGRRRVARQHRVRHPPARATPEDRRDRDALDRVRARADRRPARPRRRSRGSRRRRPASGGTAGGGPSTSSSWTATTAVTSRPALPVAREAERDGHPDGRER